MEWTGLNDLREMFLSFFESKQHVRLQSAPLTPKDDASLLLINSGMAPLKKYFLGLESIPGNRAASCQKCIRTPDIERVGKTSRHGTFFEMLGNFSFGDYFKEDATKWAWEFITDTLKIPEDRLWVSIYEQDDEAFEIWTKHRGLAPERVVRLGKADNFWEIGSGPCGPCSEIYYDRGEEYGCSNPDCAVGCDCDRYVEFWNLVFTQYNSDGQGTYTPLEKPNIDTGMGLERLACIVQGVGNLFEVDTVQNIMRHIAEIAGVQYKQDEKTDISLRVITDHIRSTVFMVSDDVVPQNEGRGYVLRRLLRRAARHGKLLGIEGPFLYKVCDTVIRENQSAYPELAENANYIRKVIHTEEERFQKTISQGMELLQTLIDKAEALQSGGERRISGEDAFKLYDTFGFPLDLTREIAEDRGFSIDENAFETLMQLQRERARKAREEQGDASWEEDALAREEFEDRFVGFEQFTVDTKVLYICKGGALISELATGVEAALVLETTPFYAESGGQTGDTGFINFGKSIFKVRGCKKSPTGHILHIGEIVAGLIAQGDSVTAMVDKTRRRAVMRNHTATHLLQTALREVLGSHVHQAGSLVEEKFLRFDFTHFSAMTSEQLQKVEDQVNKLILRAYPITISEMTMEEAKKQGATALFGDKYGDMVRVVDISGKSVELCGGTHASNTAQLGLFKILHETSVAAGVRRIEATTGRGVLRLLNEREELLRQSCEHAKVNAFADLPAKTAAMAAQVKELTKKLQEMSESIAASQINSADNMPQVGPVRVVAALLGDIEIDALKAMADRMKSQHSDAVGVLVATGSEKASFLAFAGKEAVAAGIHAGKLVQAATALAGGSGGGRPDNAMGGVPCDEEKIAAALEQVQALVRGQLGL